MTILARWPERAPLAELRDDVRGGAAELQRGLGGHRLDVRHAAHAVGAEDFAALGRGLRRFCGKWSRDLIVGLHGAFVGEGLRASEWSVCPCGRGWRLRLWI